MAKLPADSRVQFASSRVRLVQMLNNLYLNRAAAADARADGLDRDPVLALQIQLQVEKMLAQARLDKLDRLTGAEFDAAVEKYTGRARELYATQPDRFRVPELVRVAHLLIKVGPDGDGPARARAEALRARAAAGTPFAELVREASEDKGSKANGGDLGFAPASKFDPQFAAAAFALKTSGELSPVVKSSFGYHVIEFKAREPASVRPFDEVKAEIIAEIRKKIIEDARNVYIETLFKDPPPKVNEALIEKINLGTYNATPATEGASPGKR
jgi:peptidyl-prolyl cis-trans isomerase C